MVKRVSPLLAAKEALTRQEASRLSPHATASTRAIRRRPEERVEYGHRQHFSLDADRILHSLAYTRYIDKTQVFYLVDNDHITHRVLHVQFLSKIARDIGRFLRLNEDLIEAIALGHDIGHAPFGHDGERYLSAVCKQHGIGSFQHNVQSVRFLDGIERKGRGWNLSLQVLDGILCHDGEIHEERLRPQPDKTFADLDREMELKTYNPEAGLVPMTLEGCVVRLADTISYIGRDIEDAVRLNLIGREEIPENCATLLGTTNGAIVYNLVEDVTKNSMDRGAVGFSREVSEALRELKSFNYSRIYRNPKIKGEVGKIGRLLETLFDLYLEDLASKNRGSLLFTGFLDGMSHKYVENHTPPEVVRDFIAGMTDEYFMKQCHLRLLPQRMPSRF
ncbi:MAG: HD domain-containing protein [Deltaproteobacteria bacterium]|nr:MAG: HD domain-containing protein [Deltaproteobacteria bacterium]